MVNRNVSGVSGKDILFWWYLIIIVTILMVTTTVNSPVEISVSIPIGQEYSPAPYVTATPYAYVHFKGPAYLVSDLLSNMSSISSR